MTAAVAEPENPKRKGGERIVHHPYNLSKIKAFDFLNYN